jgi:hypothetical protein
VGGSFSCGVVVAAAQVLHEGVTGGYHADRAVAFQAAHRPQPGLEPTVVCLNRIIGVPLDGVRGCGHSSSRICGWPGRW